MTQDSIDPPDPLRLIKGVSFFDTPRDGEGEPDDLKKFHDATMPYIPSVKEWEDLQKSLQRLRVGMTIAIAYGTISLIAFIVEHATKI